MTMYSELEGRLRGREPLSREWHSTLSEFAQKLIDDTKGVREAFWREDERYRLGLPPSCAEAHIY